MIRLSVAAFALAIAACAPVVQRAEQAAAPAVPVFTEAQALAYLGQIDPLGGTWRLLAFDGPPIGKNRRALLQGHEGAFLSTSGECTSSSSSYVRIGARIEITRHIPPETGKCDDPAAASLDRALAHAVASARAWSIDAAGRLHLTGADGAGAVFERPVPLRPDLDGRWLVEAIAGKPREGRIDFGDDSVSASAGCNSYGGHATIKPGTIRVSNGMQTLIGCGKEREAADGLLFAALNGARTWRIDETGALRIEGKDSLVARRPAPATFRLPGRYQLCNNSTLPDISHDGDVWFEFGPDTVRDQAGCSAGYVADGSALRLSPGDAPACQTPALATRGAAEIGGPARSPLAQFRPDGFAWDAEGRLRLRTHRGLLALCRYVPG